MFGPGVTYFRKLVKRAEECNAAGQSQQVASLPRISHHALAGVARGNAGELALEGSGGGPAVQPFHIGGGSDEGCVVRLRSTIDHEGCAGQRLERRTDNSVGVE